MNGNRCKKVNTIIYSWCLIQIQLPFVNVLLPVCPSWYSYPRNLKWYRGSIVSDLMFLHFWHVCVQLLRIFQNRKYKLLQSACDALRVASRWMKSVDLNAALYIISLLSSLQRTIQELLNAIAFFPFCIKTKCKRFQDKCYLHALEIICARKCYRLDPDSRKKVKNSILFLIQYLCGNARFV